MNPNRSYDVDPAYGGADHPHPHSDPEVDQGYGGENSPHRHDAPSLGISAPLTTPLLIPMLGVLPVPALPAQTSPARVAWLIFPLLQQG